MINHMPFFRFPFSPYSRSYPPNYYHTPNSISMNTSKASNDNPSAHTEIRKIGDGIYKDKENMNEKKSSKYYHIGPIFLNTNGLSDKEEPLLEISGRKLYLDDLIILALLFFLYKEDVRDDMLFMLLILLLVG